MRWWATLLAAAGATIFIYGVMKWLTVHGTRLPLIWELLLVNCIPFFFLGILVGFRIARHRSSRIWLAAFRAAGAAYGGIAVGVIIWVVVEESVFRRFGTYPIYEEHNLFPIEIVIKWVVAAIPIGIGTWLGFQAARARTI